MNPAQQAIEMLEKVEAAVEKLQGIINGTLSHVPGILDWIFDKVKEGWDALMKKLQEFWDWFTDVLSYVGDPFALAAAATAWKTQVGGIAKNLARDTDDSDLRVDDSWEGNGADQYRQSVPPQREALLSLQADFATNIANALETVRMATIVFWGGVVTAIVAVIVGFSVATGAAVTVFGLPLAPPAALGGIATALVAMGVAVAIMHSQTASAKSGLDTAAAGVNSWPTFVTA